MRNEGKKDSEEMAKILKDNFSAEQIADIAYNAFLSGELYVSEIKGKNGEVMPPFIVQSINTLLIEVLKQARFQATFPTGKGYFGPGFFTGNKKKVEFRGGPQRGEAAGPTGPDGIPKKENGNG